MVIWRSSTGIPPVRTVLVFASGFSIATIFPMKTLSNLPDNFPGQSIDFFGALRARVYDDKVGKWISGVGVNSIGKKLMNSKEGGPVFEQPKMTIAQLMEYGNMLVQEQENVKRVQLADKYLSETGLGDANADSINRRAFYG